MSPFLSIVRNSLPIAVLASPVLAQTWTSSHPDMPQWAIRYAATVAEEAGENQIFVMGGISYSVSQPQVWRFHRDDGWVVLGDMPAARSYCKSVTVKVGGVDRIVLLGGSSGGPPTNTCWWYDPATDSWDTTTPAPMPTARGNVEAVTAPNGLVYVFGGTAASGLTPSLEIYDPVANSWSTGPSMPQTRHGFAALADCDGFIYIQGGELGGSYNASIACFNTNTNTWIASNPHVGGAFPDMPFPRAHLGGALGRNGVQYLMGGNYYSAEPIADVDSYDPYDNTWSTEPSMLEARAHFESVGMGSRIWTLGGAGKISSDTKRVESFGALSAFGPCSHFVPTLPLQQIGTTLQFATPHDATCGGLMDFYVGSLQSAWVDVNIAGMGDVMFDAEATLPSDRLVTRIFAPGGQLLGTGQPGEPALLRQQATPLSRVFVEVRNVGQNQGGAACSLLMTGSEQQKPIGEVYCSLAAPNSSGRPSFIKATGLTMAAADDVTLTVQRLPLQSYGYFLVSQTAGFIPHAGGSAGNLCLSGNIGRFAGNVLNSGQDGRVTLDVNVASIPGNPPAAAQPGDTFHFTYWHRDAGVSGPTSNFSDAIRILFR